MVKVPYFFAKWHSSASAFYYSVDGPGLHMKCDSEYQAKMIAASLNNAYLLGRLQYLESLNNAYLLGRLQYLESKFPDVEIPVNTAGPEVGSN